VTLTIAVAYSAGRDSTALLHATWRAAQAHGGIEVLALHIHHGLSSQADAWLKHAQLQCETWAQQGAPLRFQCVRLAGCPALGESVEAWARTGRYHALADMAHAAGVHMVLLAHHQQDQAETFLLQALRGAGSAGLAGMPQSIERDGLLWVRPWLEQSRERIEAYVEQHGLSYVDDDSNANPRFSRNRLRIQVWPTLLKAFPQAQASLAHSATWAQEANAALKELANQDLCTIKACERRGLPILAWGQLSPARRSNALRAWLSQQPDLVLTSSLVQRLMRELGSRLGPATWSVGAGQLRHYRGYLSWEKEVLQPAASALPETHLRITQPGRFPLPGWAGLLQVIEVNTGGVPLAWLAELVLKPRVGGEQYQAVIGGTPRSLKKQFQTAGIPPWLREGPLIYSGGQLVFVPGLGLDARILALPGQVQVTLQWHGNTEV
jgi:tRNA(Ile)-lysidine synthase